MYRLLIALLGSIFIIACGGSQLTQDQFVERTLAALADAEELGAKTTDCPGFDRDKAEARLFGDARYEAVIKQGNDLEESLAELRAEEGITILETLDPGTARLSDEKWKKLEPLAAEALVAQEEHLDVMVDIFEDELEAAGCEP